jgi:polyhydroxyalkanoate synthesis regulator phasin
MRKLWKIVGIASLVAILGMVTIGAVAYAQDESESGWPFDFGQRFKDALADILGITVDEYDAAVQQAQGQVVDEALQEGWLTEEQAELLQWRLQQAPEFGHRGMMPKGFGGFDRGMMGGGNSLTSIAADELGMSLTELLTELQDGKSMADVATDKGVDVQEIVDAYIAQVKESLDEAVADGRITQNQADWQLEQVEERVTDQLNSTWQDRSWGGKHPGGRMGFPGMGGL